MANLKRIWYRGGGNLHKAVQSFFSESRVCVKGDSGMGEWFAVEVLQRLGCMMSPWLFNMYMDGVAREVNTRVNNRGVEMIGQRGNAWRVNLLFYNDDALSS